MLKKSSKSPEYAATVINGEVVFMQDLVMCHMLGLERLPEGSYVFHKNGNTLDNRRENLELRLKLD